VSRVRLLAALGISGAGVAVVLVGLLHVLAAGQVDPVRRTISEYALGTYQTLFDVGVLGLALGSLLIAVALVRAGVARPPSAALLGAWALALVLVVVFEKANWSVGPSVGGYIHRYASLVAFVCLPVAALLMVRGRSETHAVWSRWLAALSLLWLGSIITGVVLRPFTGVPWWQFLPLGIVERGLALTEVAVVVVLGLWAWRSVPSRAELVCS
jgi:uncharacterized membrane protein YozB (DUF420 family)